jgi:hypothetical protein
LYDLYELTFDGSNLLGDEERLKKVSKIIKNKDFYEQMLLYSKV